MYAYRYRSLKKKKIKAAVWLWILLSAFIALLIQTDKSFLTKLGEEGAESCCEKVLEFYLPGLSYSIKDENEWSLVEKVIGVLFSEEDVNTESESYKTQIESDLSYETILAREAADENYVDEKTGKVIPSVGSADGTSLPDDEKEVENTKENVEEQDMAQDQTLKDTDSKEAAAVADGKVVTFAREKLDDFDYLIQHYYTVDKSTTINSSQLVVQNLLNKNCTIQKTTEDVPQILIYHTHGSEGYADSVEGDPNTSVIAVGNRLTQILQDTYGYHVLHDTGIYDTDRDHAYNVAAPAIQKILQDHPSIEVVIDLHRDGVADTTRLATNINGVDMAQVMFFNGLSKTTATGDIDYLRNPYIEDNLAMSLKMQLAATELYPGFTRKIYLKSYRYNMHLCPKSLLIEVGAQTNTLQEAVNAMDPLAQVLDKVLSGK